MNNISTCHPVHDPTALRNRLTKQAWITFACHSNIQAKFKSKTSTSISNKELSLMCHRWNKLIFFAIYHKSKDWFCKQKKEKKCRGGRGVNQKKNKNNTSCCLTRYTTSLNLAWRFPNRGSCQIAGAWSTKSFAQGQLQPFPVKWNRRCLVNFSLFIVSFHEEIKSESLA